MRGRVAIFLVPPCYSNRVKLQSREIERTELANEIKLIEVFFPSVTRTNSEKENPSSLNLKRIYAGAPNDIFSQIL